MVLSAPSPGAEMMTFLAPALRWAEAFSLLGEDAGAFERDVDAHGGVRQLGSGCARPSP
jgi:hypothetical protein